MNFRKNLLPFALTVACVATSAAAQFKVFYSTQGRSGSHSASVGNGYLGGSLTTSAGISHTRGLGYESANANFGLSAVGRLFNYSKEIAYLGANCTNSITSTGQTRTATATLRILGINWGTSSTSGHSFSKYSYNLKLFPVDIGMSFPVGPISLSVKGNCGINASAAGGCALFELQPEVQLTANVSTGAFANAYVSASIPGFGVAVEVKGEIGVQQLGMFGRANPRVILRGDAYYTLTPITIKLIGKAWALWADWSTTLASWSSGSFSKLLFQV